jgi:predicted hydrocarbon binding protein
VTPQDIAPGVLELDGFLRRPNFYAEGDYLRTDLAKGVTRNRLGTRICALTEDFLTGFRKAIIDECGPAADTVFKSIGRKWGALFAKRFEKEMTEYHGKALKEFPMAVFQACLVELFSHHGWGRLELHLEHYDRGLLLIDLKGAIMASLVQTADKPADALMAGIFAGFFAYLTGEDLDCVQTACSACGAASSSFVVGLTARLAPAQAWADGGKSHQEIVAELAELRV